MMFFNFYFSFFSNYSTTTPHSTITSRSVSPPWETCNCYWLPSLCVDEGSL
jgi:hypothetical protein